MGVCFSGDLQQKTIIQCLLFLLVFISDFLYLFLMFGIAAAMYNGPMYLLKIKTWNWNWNGIPYAVSSDNGARAKMAFDWTDGVHHTWFGFLNLPHIFSQLHHTSGPYWHQTMYLSEFPYNKDHDGAISCTSVPQFVSVRCLIDFDRMAFAIWLIIAQAHTVEYRYDAV